MAITNADFSRATAGVGPSSAVTTVVNAINSGGGVPTSRTISTTAPLAGGGDLSANRTLTITAATNAAPGAATAVQITALEGLQKGLPTVDSAVSGAISLTAATTFLAPTTTTAFTLAAGTNGQQKLIVLTAAQSTTITGISGWVGTAPGDYIRLLYFSGASMWITLDSRTTP